MALDEMGLRGWAEIASVEPCPVIEEGPGRIVTGTFRHESRELRRIGLSEFTVTGALSLVQGPDRPGAISSVLEPTGGHPIYSLTRQDWVPARDLSVGELVETRNGPALVATNEAQPGSRTVFNLEVEGTHEYFAGDGAVRSHNGCVKGAPKVTPPGKWPANAPHIRAWHNKRTGELFGNTNGKSINTPRRTYDAEKSGFDIEYKSDNFSKGPRSQGSIDRMVQQIDKDGEIKANGQGNPHWHFEHDPSNAPEMTPVLEKLSQNDIPWTFGNNPPF